MTSRADRPGTSAGEPPPRPAGMTPDDLRFTPQHAMVPWLSPRLLCESAVRVLVSSIFGAYADKREIQAGLPAGDLPRYDDQDELWLDYVADTGDAFGPTYTMASLLAAERLDVEVPGAAPIATERGRLLVFGGDQVYPSASYDSYRDRTLGPYRAALPWLAEGNPHLYAVPGNHDWYDGLTSFMRVFCHGAWVGGWQTQQRRTYFALRLPQPWWLWAIDVQLDAYIDEPQLAYFRSMAAQLAPGDGLILCSALPGWVHSNEDDVEAFSTLDYFERKVIRPTGARVLLSIAGDAHCYARYEAVDGGANKIISGGGGAFLSATHHLPDEIEVPPVASRDPGRTTPPIRYVRRARYPDARTSRWRRATVAILPFRNPSFWALVGVVHLLYLWLIQSSLRDPDEGFRGLVRDLTWNDLVRGIARSPIALVLTAALFWGLVGFTKSDSIWRRSIGLLHAAAHLAAVVVGIRLAAILVDGVSSPGWYLAGVIVLVGVGGGLLGSWVTAAYLALADLVRCNTNELFAAQRIRDHKNFLRIHIGRDGVLTVHPIAVPRTVRRWRLREGGTPSDTWLVPDSGMPVRAELAEDRPIRLDPRTG